MEHIRQVIIFTLLAALFACFPFEISAQRKTTKAPAKPRPKATPKSSPGDTAIEMGLKLFSEGTTTSLQSALEQFSRAAELYEQGNNSEGVGNSRILLGRTYKKLNDIQEASRQYEMALDIYTAIGNVPGRAAALNNIGGVLRDLGRFADSVTAYQSALPLMRQTKNRKGEAQSLNGLGESLFALGQRDQAVARFREAEAIWQTLSANEDKVRTIFNLGTASLAMGQTDSGLSYYQTALNDSRQFNDPILEGDILEAMAAYYNSVGELVKAIEYRRRIFDAYRKSKASTVTTSRVLLSVNNLQVSYYRAGRFAEAFEMLEEGIALGRQSNESLVTAFLVGNKGILLSDQGRFRDAIGFLEQGIAAARQSGNKLPEGYFLAGLSRVYLELGDYRQALAFAKQAVQVVPSGFEPETEGKVVSQLIRAYVANGDKGGASDAIRMAVNRNLDKGSNAGAVQVLGAMGFASLVSGQSEQALRMFDQAYTLASKLNHEVEKARTLYEASFAYSAAGNYQNALQALQRSHDFFKGVGNDHLDMKTHIEMAANLLKVSRVDESIQNLNAALEFAQKLNDTVSEGIIFYNLGLVYQQARDNNRSLQYFNSALQIAERLNDAEAQRRILNNVADLYEKSGDKRKGKEYRDKAKKVRN